MLAARRPAVPFFQRFCRGQDPEWDTMRRAAWNQSVEQRALPRAAMACSLRFSAASVAQRGSNLLINERSSSPMRKSHFAVSTMVLSGALAIGSVPAWSQSGTGSGSSGATSGSQDQQRSRANQMGNGHMSGQGHMGQWSREDIRGVQEALRDKGHNPGAIDGIMGPRTQQALRQFQQAQNLQATGQLDANTASALGVASASGATGSGASSSTGRSGSGTGSMGSGSSTTGSGSSSMGSGSSGGSTGTGSSGGSNRGTTGSTGGGTGSGSGSGATR